MKNSIRHNVFLASSYAGVLIIGMFLGIKFIKNQDFDVTKNPKFAVKKNLKEDEILHIIDRNYVDEINTKSLRNKPIDSILHKLDPHSAYLPPAELKSFSENLEGNFEGVGIEYYMLNDTMMVTGVVKDGPAYAAGIKLGDKIIKIDSTVVSGKNLPREKFAGRFKGKSGSVVKVSVLGFGKTSEHKVFVKRGKVNLTSIDAAYLINPETGYIRISKFGSQTDEDFIQSANQLKKNGMKKLILDLRDNGGGYFGAATRLADQFLSGNKLIVYTEGKHDPRTDYYSTGKGKFQNGKLAVLINENTASASEIVAGAIQDLDRGIIIGRRSFGKGLVQEQFPFTDGSALNLTIARYYTPSGKSIQKSYNKGYDAYQNEIDDRLNAGELTKDLDTLKKYPEIKQNKKPVLDGGIKPNIYVKLDTLGYNSFYNQLIEKKILNDFVFRVLTTRYSAEFIEENINTFNLSEADFRDFLAFVLNKKISIEKSQTIASRNVIESDLKAILCRYYLGDNGYYKSINQNDSMVKQALLSLQ